MKFPTLTDSERQNLLTPRSGKTRVVIDSDTFNEVDDQFAVAYALRSPERLDVEAIYAAPFTSMPDGGMVPDATNPSIGMKLSYKEILHILDLMDECADGRVFRGATHYLESEDKPAESDAARDLVTRAMQGNQPLYVLAIGAITNVASAIMMEPEIIKRIVVIWLGGQPHHFPYTIEFNLMQDVCAARLVFDCGVPLVHIPCMGAASNLKTTPDELNRFLKKGRVGSYLADIVDKACEGTLSLPAPIPASGFMRDGYLKGMNDYPDKMLDGFFTHSVARTRTIWDISTVAYAVNPTWCPSTLVPSPILTKDARWQQGNGRHLIRQCNYVHRDAVFGDLFAKLG